MTTLREAAQQALEALEFMADEWGFTQKANRPERWQAITALRAALEQPEQEPVAILHRYPSKASLRVVYTDEITEVDEGSWPLYLHPPRREWRGLTEEEIQSIHDTYHKRMGPKEFARAIEAALKERNA